MIPNIIEDQGWQHGDAEVDLPIPILIPSKRWGWVWVYKKWNEKNETKSNSYQFQKKKICRKLMSHFFQNNICSYTLSKSYIKLLIIS